ncbi:hypothetical protein [Paenibacillus chibensis]|uniref:hypothetical protein n=1 Tax=Paenibacillus chibensis TaxID=59846 RepID=UPI001FE42A98|nr:hypothetical protein [Paenibacillus chibensis]
MIPNLHALVSVAYRSSDRDDLVRGRLHLPSRFYDSFVKSVGMTPLEWRMLAR